MSNGHAEARTPGFMAKKREVGVTCSAARGRAIYLTTLNLRLTVSPPSRARTR